MANSHRKLLSEPDYSNQPIDCSLCGSTCPYDCDYAAIYWPPQLPPPPPPPTTNNDTSTTHISPFVIIIVALIACAILLISYFLIIKRYCTRFRVNNESQDFMNEDHHPEIDHPIWYINTIGLQPAVIRSIAVVKFKKGDNIIDVTDCSVCLSEFEDDESLRLLPKCNHAFHVPCIDMWLRSHTNCPLCRAAVLSNNSNTSSQLNDEIGSQMENEENEGELGLNSVQETGIEETQDSKTEIESVSRLRRSFSMDAAADIVHTESNSSNSGIEIQGLNHVRDLRTRSMMTMRSFSYGGRSII